MAKLTKTKTAGIFRGHSTDCSQRGRCSCAYVVVSRYRGKQYTATYRTYDEAREAKAGRDSGERRPETKRTFADYFDEWIESYTGRTTRGFSETTRREYRRPVVDHVLAEWRTWKLSEIEPADVRDLFGRMHREGQSRQKIQKVKASLSVMFATALEDGLVRSNPVQGVRVPSDPNAGTEEERAKALTRAELSMLLDAMPEEWRLFHEFLAVTGLRISEAVGLTWKHLELGENPRVLVREQFYKGERKKLKSRAGRREVPLSASMAAKLLEHRRDAYSGENAPVFPSKAGTELLPANVYRRALTPAAISLSHFEEWTDTKGQIRRRSTVSFHTFRHTCASMLFEAGRDVKQVSEWLGHTDPGFTLRTYVHLLDQGVGSGLDLDLNAAWVNTGSTGRRERPANQPPDGTA